MVSRKDLRTCVESANGKEFTPISLSNNELGSTMEVEHFDGINFTGTYTSLVSANGQSAKGALFGSIAGDAIAFLVNWKDEFTSLTAWFGLVPGDENRPATYAFWHLLSTPPRMKERGSQLWRDPICSSLRTSHSSGADRDITLLYLLGSHRMNK
jgi:Avidin family